MKRFQINNLTVHFKRLEKVNKTKPKNSRKKELIQIKAETNEIENIKNREKSTKQKDGSLKRSTKLTHLRLD